MKINIFQLILLIVVFFTLPILALIANLNKKINKLSKKDTNKLKNDDNLEKNNIIDQYNLENINILESNYNTDINNNIVNKFNNIFKEFNNLNNKNVKDNILFQDINNLNNFDDNYDFKNDINSEKYKKNIKKLKIKNIKDKTKNSKKIETKINSQLNNLKIKEKLLKKDISSETLLSVTKVVSKHWDKNGINVYENEKKWLNILKNSDIIARPIHFDDNTRTITTEYAGEKINKDNLPQDWEKQRDYIISELEKYNCRHNDIKPEEILVDKGKIKIIDFGWAYEKNKDNPKSWPECLGNDFKSDKNVFNDKESFNKSISYIKAL
jgi:hypothetical protein